jgi:threonyl-tRNA synthetase
MLHTDEFESRVVEKSTRPKSIDSEEEKEGTRKMEKNLTVLFCVEKEDNLSKVSDLCKEIIKATEDFSTDKIMIAPFVHLSNNISSPKVAKEMYEELVKKFQGSKYIIETSHFGYHKSLLLKVKGHPGSFRYREF